MTSSDESDCLDQDADEYEIMFRHTEQGFKYRKDVLAKLRRSNSGTGRKSRDQARNDRAQEKINITNREIPNLESEIQILNHKYSEAKNNYVARHKELEALRAHLETLRHEIYDYDSSKAENSERKSSLNDAGEIAYERQVKTEVSFSSATEPS